MLHCCFLYNHSSYKVITYNYIAISYGGAHVNHIDVIPSQIDCIMLFNYLDYYYFRLMNFKWTASRLRV